MLGQGGEAETRRSITRPIQESRREAMRVWTAAAAVEMVSAWILNIL